ncbi:unnamed protein product [Scytosiphon promiscuus]
MSTALNALLALPSTSLPGHGSGTDGAVENTRLGALRDSKTTVYDFWTTRCTNCPAALDALDAIARQRPSVKFVGVNIDDAVAAGELINQAASEGRWTGLTHAHLAEDEKEKAKDILGMKTVPFYVVVSEDGTVLRHGSAKVLPLKSAEFLDSVLADGAPGGAGNDRKDGVQHATDENDASAANVAPATAAAAAAPAVAKGKSSAPPMECEGGVCKLVRKPKKKAPAGVAPEEAAAAAETTSPAATPAARTKTVECEGGVCKLVRKPKKEPEKEMPREPLPAAVPAASSDATPAAATRKVECEGGVCKLVRKPKKDAAVGVAEATSPGATPAAKARTMECEGGVCKLVRKPKEAVDAEGANEPAAAADAAAEKLPLGVGDAMPPLQVMRLDGGPGTTLDEIRAGRPAVLDFWTTRCVRCPAALDTLEGLAAASSASAAKEAGDGADGAVTYVSLNLDSLEGARQMVSEGGGRWPSLSHVFAGGHDDQSETLLESFKARAGLKSVPFYVVLAADGRIEQIGGPKAVKLENKTDGASSSKGDAVAAVVPPALAQPAARPAAQPAAPKASSFTMDEDF